MNPPSSEQTEPLNYFSLMEKVGTKGKYQWSVFALMFFLWMSVGIAAISIPFLFLNPGFDCTSFGISQIQCEYYVCANFGKSERQQFEAEKYIDSLVTEFGPFHCE